MRYFWIERIESCDSLNEFWPRRLLVDPLILVESLVSSPSRALSGLRKESSSPLRSVLICLKSLTFAPRLVDLCPLSLVCGSLATVWIFLALVIWVLENLLLMLLMELALWLNVYWGDGEMAPEWMSVGKADYIDWCTDCFLPRIEWLLIWEPLFPWLLDIWIVPI